MYIIFLIWFWTLVNGIVKKMVHPTNAQLLYKNKLVNHYIVESNQTIL